MDFKPHQVDWTQEKINRFWDFFVKNKALFNLSFAGEVGKDIISRTAKYISGDVLDYGCGGGTLMKYLIDEGFGCCGLDASIESINKAKENIGNNPKCKGFVLSTALPNREIENGKFQMVYFIETIEHLLPEEIDKYLNELYRIISPGGYVFISTPHNEDREKYEVICPDCGAIFHRVQHLNTFTVDRMIGLTNKAGFEKVFCEATYLMKPTLMNYLRRFWRNISGNNVYPHLIYLGQKPLSQQ